MSRMGDQGKAEDGGSSQEDPPFPLTDVDKWVLSQTDEGYHLHTWDELREIIGKHKCSSYFDSNSLNSCFGIQVKDFQSSTRDEAECQSRLRGSNNLSMNFEDLHY